MCTRPNDYICYLISTYLNTMKKKLIKLYCQCSRCREERPTLSFSYLNRRCHNDLPSLNLKQKTCVSYRKQIVKHVSVMSVSYVNAFFSSFEPLKFGILSYMAVFLCRVYFIYIFHFQLLYGIKCVHFQILGNTSSTSQEYIRRVFPNFTDTFT